MTQVQIFQRMKAVAGQSICAGVYSIGDEMVTVSIPRLTLKDWKTRTGCDNDALAIEAIKWLGDKRSSKDKLALPGDLGSQLFKFLEHLKAISRTNLSG